MKKSILLTAVLLLFFGYSMNGSERKQKKNSNNSFKPCNKDTPGIIIVLKAEFSK